MKNLLFILLFCPILVSCQVNTTVFIENKLDSIIDILSLKREQLSNLWWSEYHQKGDNSNEVLDIEEKLEEYEGLISNIKNYLYLSDIENFSMKLIKNKSKLLEIKISNVECDSFFMESWDGNWVREGVDPGEESSYENWNILFYLDFDIGCKLPITIQKCGNYIDKENIIKFLFWDLTIGKTYNITVDIDYGERGNGFILNMKWVEQVPLDYINKSSVSFINLNGNELIIE